MSDASAPSSGVEDGETWWPPGDFENDKAWPHRGRVRFGAALVLLAIGGAAVLATQSVYRVGPVDDSTPLTTSTTSAPTTTPSIAQRPAPSAAPSTVPPALITTTSVVIAPASETTPAPAEALIPTAESEPSTPERATEAPTTTGPRAASRAPNRVRSRGAAAAARRRTAPAGADADEAHVHRAQGSTGRPRVRTARRPTPHATAAVRCSAEVEWRMRISRLVVASICACALAVGCGGALPRTPLPSPFCKKPSTPSTRTVTGSAWTGRRCLKSERADLETARTPQEFAGHAAELLRSAKDVHIWLDVAGGRRVPTRLPPRDVNFNKDVLHTIITDVRQHGPCMASGRIDKTIGYVLIGSWEREKCGLVETEFPNVIADLSATTGLVIDVRPNTGGDERIARSVAKYFVNGPVVYAKRELRDADAPGGFTPREDAVLTPAEGIAAYGKPTAVLTGRSHEQQRSVPADDALCRRNAGWRKDSWRIGQSATGRARQRIRLSTPRLRSSVADGRAEPTGGTTRPPSAGASAACPPWARSNCPAYGPPSPGSSASRCTPTL